MNNKVEDAVRAMYSLIATCEELNDEVNPLGILAEKM